MATSVRENWKNLASPALSVGIVSADLLRLGEQVRLLEQTRASALHFDVMDGCFVPTLSVGVPFIKAIQSTLLKDVHLMIEDPYEKVADFAKAGADLITVHLEACRDVGKVLDRLKDLENVNHPGESVLRGLAINPATPVELVRPYLADLDYLLVLAVDPTQRKMPQMQSQDLANKCQQVKEAIGQVNEAVVWGIDGGITLSNFSDLAKLGPGFLVSGSAIFKEQTPAETIDRLVSNGS